MNSTSLTWFVWILVAQHFLCQASGVCCRVARAIVEAPVGTGSDTQCGCGNYAPPWFLSHDGEYLSDETLGPVLGIDLGSRLSGALRHAVAGDISAWALYHADDAGLFSSWSRWCDRAGQNQLQQLRGESIWQGLAAIHICHEPFFLVSGSPIIRPRCCLYRVGDGLSLTMGGSVHRD